VRAGRAFTKAKLKSEIPWLPRVKRRLLAGVAAVVVILVAFGVYLLVLQSSGAVANCEGNPTPLSRLSCEDSATSSLHAFSIISYGAYSCIPNQPPCNPGVAMTLWNGLDRNVTIASISFDGTELSLYPLATQTSAGCHCAQFGSTEGGTSYTTLPYAVRTLALWPSSTCETGTHTLTLDTTEGTLSFILSFPSSCPSSSFS
jgi:hypothetical protein